MLCAPAPSDVTEAEQALPLCQKGRPEITFQELETMAATLDGSKLSRANADYEAEARFRGVTRISADPTSGPATRGQAGARVDRNRGEHSSVRRGRRADHSCVARPLARLRPIQTTKALVGRHHHGIRAWTKRSVPLGGTGPPSDRNSVDTRRGATGEWRLRSV